MTIEILCTLGPASINDAVIDRLAEFGATLFRINLSHTEIDQVAPTIEYIRGRTAVPICLDSEGAQVRTTRLADGPMHVEEKNTIIGHAGPFEADAGNIGLYPGYIVAQLQLGDLLSIDFDSVLAQVIDIDARGVAMRVLNGGMIGSNKAVTVQRDIEMPALTEKDVAAIGIGVAMGVTHFALSFANQASDVEEMRRHAGDDAFLISKIECRNGLRNIDEIAAVSNALLIDRGDLSREITIEQIPRIQKAIIDRARKAGKKVYVATNLLESMVSAPTPTRAEVNDIYNTLADGADGLVLAAETAIGAYPIQCAGMIARMIQQFENPVAGNDLGVDMPASLLVPPHGGVLVQRVIDEPDQSAFADLPRLRISRTDLMDCEQIAHGTYSPLTGFMNRETLESVLQHCRLPNGTAWTLPIVLGVGREQARRLGKGDRVALTDDTGSIHALLDIDDVFKPEMDTILEPWFGTAAPAHPGVRRVLQTGEYFVGGAVTLVKRLSSDFRPYELTPEQSRFIFAHKGWSRVVGFHTRNPAHRVHEHIQHEAIRRVAADGLYISPIIGPKKPNDFLPAPILKSYQLLMDGGIYPPGKVVLGSFATYSRYCGPREAVFTALCRKNMGCSHFIIGRDHTGVGDFYPADGNTILFDRIGDIGIVPLFFGTFGYDPQTRKYSSAADSGQITSISGTEARETLRAGRSLPEWFMRDIVQNMLREEMSAGHPVFHE